MLIIKFFFKFKNMETGSELYEMILDKIIQNHKHSLQEILSTIRDLNFFEEDILLRLISYLKMSTLYEITCDNFGDFKYYILILGEGYFIFYDNCHCTCNTQLSKKLKSTNLCMHYLLYKILYNINCFIKIQIDKDNMIQLAKIAKEKSLSK